MFARFVCFSFFFFFKQKTAYEMRISDWSSDVCSSDLSTASRGLVAAPVRFFCLYCFSQTYPPCRRRRLGPPAAAYTRPTWLRQAKTRLPWLQPATTRSEEHTSELQSLIRTSSAVFRLTHKKQAQAISQTSTEHNT